VVHLAAKLPSSEILKELLKDRISYVNIPDNQVDLLRIFFQ